MTMTLKHLKTSFAVLAVLLAGTVALAAAPGWMPGFPMRMGTNVMLMWTPLPGATAYNIYKSGKEGDLGAKLTSLPMNNHMDMNVPNDQTVVYTVKAVINGAESDPSQPGKLLGLKPLDPPKFNGFLHDGTVLNIRWDATQGAAFYNVYKAPGKDGPFSLVSSVQETKYVDSDAKEGNTYYFQLTAVDKLNVESPKSPVIEVVIAKALVVDKAKVYTEVLKPMKFLTYWYGSDEVPLKNPINLAVAPDGSMVYVSNTTGIISLNMEGVSQKRFDKPEKYQGDWGQPLYITVADDGAIWSTWAGGAADIRKLDPVTGEVLVEFKLPKPGNETAAPTPIGIAVSSDGNLWVTDNYYQQVVVMTPTGEVVKRIGEARMKTSDFKAMKGLTGITYSKAANRMYAADPVQGGIRIFDVATMDFVKKNDEPYYGRKTAGSGAGYAVLLKGVYAAADGTIAMMDGGKKTINILDRDLDYLYNLATSTKDAFLEDTGSPTQVAIIDGYVLVVEVADSRIAIFTTEQ